MLREVLILDINVKDFESLELSITAKNLTSRTSVPLYYKKTRPAWAAQNDEAQDFRAICFEEFSEEGIVLDMPEKSCSKGHILRLSIAVEGLESPESFTFDVTVRNIEVLTEQRQRVEAELASDKIDEWQRLQRIFTQRQDEIDQFLRAAKG